VLSDKSNTYFIVKNVPLDFKPRLGTHWNHHPEDFWLEYPPRINPVHVNVSIKFYSPKNEINIGITTDLLSE
jgi:hypothetical protein